VVSGVLYFFVVSWIEWFVLLIDNLCFCIFLFLYTCDGLVGVGFFLRGCVSWFLGSGV